MLCLKVQEQPNMLFAPKLLSIGYAVPLPYGQFFLSEKSLCDQVLLEKQGQVLNVKLRQKLELESKMIDVPRLRIGQLVRIKEETSKFAKSNIPKFSKEVYKVEKVLPHSPTPGYVLRSTSTYAVLPGSFNYYQLQSI